MIYYDIVKKNGNNVYRPSKVPKNGTTSKKWRRIT